MNSLIINRLYARFHRQTQHANIHSGRGSKKALIERFVNFQQQAFKLSDISQAFPTISRDQIRTTLRGLRDQQVITTQGKGRHTVWIKRET